MDEWWDAALGESLDSVKFVEFQRIALFCVAWQNWKQRNALIFQGKTELASVVAQKRPISVA